MAVSLRQARDLVYGTGALWERALYSFLFEDEPVEPLWRALAAYKNPDGGWGGDLEHDIKCPRSHVLALEWLLRVQSDTGFPIGRLLEGTVGWVEAQRLPDGSLRNPPELLDYPHARWWSDGGQTMPDSITGNLLRLGLCSATLAESTAAWVGEHLSPEAARANDWLFMAYHGYDYYLNAPQGPGVDAGRRAVIENIAACAAGAPERQYHALFSFVPGPQSPVARALAPGLLDRYLEHLLDTQRDDGSWMDEHNLPQWWPYTTISVLLALRRHGRLARALGDRSR